MLSTGNDIVSLNAINVTRTKQPNFYSKILTPTETALYQQPGFATIPFEVFVWLLWSIKESAFKFLQRIDANIFFTPVKFEVSDMYMSSEFKLIDFNLRELTGVGFDRFECISSTINFGEYTLCSKSLVYKNFISTVVSNTKNSGKIYWGIKQIDSVDTEIQSSEVKKFVTKGFQEILSENNVTIKKSKNGIPFALRSNDELIPISLSHHENWVAYSFQLIG